MYNIYIYISQKIYYLGMSENELYKQKDQFSLLELAKFSLGIPTLLSDPFGYQLPISKNAVNVTLSASLGGLYQPMALPGVSPVGKAKNKPFLGPTFLESVSNI